MAKFKKIFIASRQAGMGRMGQRERKNEIHYPKFSILKFITLSLKLFYERVDDLQVAASTRCFEPAPFLFK